MWSSVLCTQVVNTNTGFTENEPILLCNCSMSHQLKEALYEVSLLSLELNKSTGLAEESDKLNIILSEELTTASMQKEEMSREMDQLMRKMTEEQEKTIGVLEEQLQKQHEVEVILDSTQQELNAQVKKCQALTEDLEKKHGFCEELQGRIEMLEQSLHQEHAVSWENELLKESMSEHEGNIETLEDKCEALEIANQNLTEQNSFCETQIRESMSAIEELSKRLSEMLAVKGDSDEEKVHLHERVLSLQQDNRTLRESLESMNSKLEMAIASIKSLNDKHQDEVCKY